MKTIKVSYRRQPILDEKDGTGLNRDRHPDKDWPELRNTNLKSDSISEAPLDEAMKLILLEDLAYAYGQSSNKFREKLKEFGLI